MHKIGSWACLQKLQINKAGSIEASKNDCGHAHKSIIPQNVYDKLIM